jgi:hypothetical protein
VGRFKGTLRIILTQRVQGWRGEGKEVEEEVSKGDWRWGRGEDTGWQDREYGKRMKKEPRDVAS